MQIRAWFRLAIAPCLVALAGGLALAPAASSAAASASGGGSQRVHPLSVVTIAGLHCKVGFLVHDGKTVYAAVPASCGALPQFLGTVQDGCMSANAPVGGPARVAGQTHRSIIAYDSFVWMESHGVHASNRCHFNDLMLIKLNPADAKRARGAIPGTTSPKRISSGGPSSGAHLTLGHKAATSAGTAHHRWTYPLSKAPTVTASDVGTPILRGSVLYGMLTTIPQGTVMKTEAGGYNVHRALLIAKRALKIKHLSLLRAGQRP